MTQYEPGHSPAILAESFVSHAHVYLFKSDAGIPEFCRCLHNNVLMRVFDTFSTVQKFTHLTCDGLAFLCCQCYPRLFVTIYFSV